MQIFQGISGKIQRQLQDKGHFLGINVRKTIYQKSSEYGLLERESTLDSPGCHQKMTTSTVGLKQWKFVLSIQGTKSPKSRCFYDNPFSEVAKGRDRYLHSLRSRLERIRRSLILSNFEKQSRKLHYVSRSKNNPPWPKALLSESVTSSRSSEGIHLVPTLWVLHSQDPIPLWPLQLFLSSHSFYIVPHLCSFHSRLPMFLILKHSQSLGS